jgi:beta-phosphoglucomutase-like phosphatase (HAD superfamily)
VAIEDSLAGIEAAKAAGLFVIAVSTNAAVDKLQQADHVIDHIGQLSNFMPM